MTFDILKIATPPFTMPEMVLNVMADEDTNHGVAAMRLDKRLQETTHFYHGVSVDIDGNRRWYVMAHLNGAHSNVATTEYWYGNDGADMSRPLSDAERSEAEGHVFALLRADFFTVLGLEPYIP